MSTVVVQQASPIALPPPTKLAKEKSTMSIPLPPPSPSSTLAPVHKPMPLAVPPPNCSPPALRQPTFVPITVYPVIFAPSATHKPRPTASIVLSTPPDPSSVKFFPQIPPTAPTTTTTSTTWRNVKRQPMVSASPSMGSISFHQQAAAPQTSRLVVLYAHTNHGPTPKSFALRRKLLDTVQISKSKCSQKMARRPSNRPTQSCCHTDHPPSLPLPQQVEQPKVVWPQQFVAVISVLPRPL